MRFVLALIVFAVALPTLAAAQAQVFTFEQGVSGFTGFDDTTIFSEFDNSGGGTDGIFSGTINQLTFGGDTRHRRALIRIDLSSIPSGWTVNSVSLQMTVELSGGNFGDIDYSLHRVLKTWGEGVVVGPSAGGFGGPAQSGDATWQANRYLVSAWDNAGGDFEPIASATAAAGTAGSNVTWSDPGMVADVQRWVDIPLQNKGWIVISALEGTQQRVKKFHSSEAAQFRPVLTVVATPPALGVPGRIAEYLVGATLLLVGAFLLRRRPFSS